MSIRRWLRRYGFIASSDVGRAPGCGVPSASPGGLPVAL